MRWALNCSILFQEVPILERPAAAAAAGFRHIEFWWPFPVPVPADRDVEAFVSAVESAGVDLVGLNFAAGDMPGGDRGLVSWVGRDAEFRDSVAVATGIAERLGTRAFNALYGNRIEGVAATAQDELAVQNLAYAAGLVEPLGGTVLVEPVSGAPRYPLRTAADVLAVIDRVPAANVRLLADLYHLATNGDDVAAVIARDIDRIGHVQVADSPGRHEPGTGELDIAGHLAALAAGGYDGYVALEFSPATTTAAALAALDLIALLP